jgi:hypothetical protein
MFPTVLQRITHPALMNERLMSDQRQAANFSSDNNRVTFSVTSIP